MAIAPDLASAMFVMMLRQYLANYPPVVVLAIDVPS
jgi:hypothetical protein